MKIPIDQYRIVQVQTGDALRLELQQRSEEGRHYPNAAPINHAYVAPADPLKSAVYDTVFLSPANPDPRGGERYAREAEETLSEQENASQDEGSLNQCLFCRKSHQTLSATQPDASCANCGSPLFIVPRMQPQLGHRRAAKRLSRQGEIVFYTRWPQKVGYSGRIKNMSPNGLQFQTSEAVAKSQILKITGDFLVALGRVSHVAVLHDNAMPMYVVGVEFCTIRYSSLKGMFFSAKT